MHIRTCHVMRDFINAVSAALRSGRTTKETAERQMREWSVPQHVITRIAG